MPTRMVRDWTNSDKINDISFQAEVLFLRLIMKADDFGCFYADSKRLKANLFPIKDSVRDSDISRWMAECQKAGMIVVYEVDSKKYLQIVDFGQRKRQMQSKFPPPSIDGQLSDNCPPEEEVEEEVEKEEEGKRKRFAPPQKNDVIDFMSEKLDDFTAMGEADKFMNFYEAKDWFIGKNKMKNWKAAASGWISRMNDFGSKPIKKQDLEKQFEAHGNNEI